MQCSFSVIPFPGCWYRFSTFGKEGRSRIALSYGDDSSLKPLRGRVFSGRFLTGGHHQPRPEGEKSFSWWVSPKAPHCFLEAYPTFHWRSSCPDNTVAARSSHAPAPLLLLPLMLVLLRPSDQKRIGQGRYFVVWIGKEFGKFPVKELQPALQKCILSRPLHDHCFGLKWQQIDGACKTLSRCP